jgi:hypothetical protein
LIDIFRFLILHMLWNRELHNDLLIGIARKVKIS